MKTSEFIKRVEQLGYEVVDDFDGIGVYRDDSMVSIVCKNKVNKLDTYWEEDIPHYLLYLCVEYAKTPIEERKSEKKYYLKLPLNSDRHMSYLNYYEEDRKFNFISKGETIHWKTKFTQREIDNMPNQDFIKTLIKEEVK